MKKGTLARVEKIIEIEGNEKFQKMEIKGNIEMKIEES